jgi:DNA invertase Pin-like site-specific DNA recombinase
VTLKDCLLKEPHTEIARECGVSKVTVSRIKAHYDPNRPCNELGRPKKLENLDVI